MPSSCHELLIFQYPAGWAVACSDLHHKDRPSTSAHAKYSATWCEPRNVHFRLLRKFQYRPASVRNSTSLQRISVILDLKCKPWTLQRRTTLQATSGSAGFFLPPSSSVPSRTSSLSSFRSAHTAQLDDSGTPSRYSSL